MKTVQELSDAEIKKRLDLLKKPFPPEKVNKLARTIVKANNGMQPPKFKCEPNKRWSNEVSADGAFCGGYHARAVHLDYVGHAEITERLNEVDPFWKLEFKYHNKETGAPMCGERGAYFVLTVLGIERTCYGDPGRKGLSADGHKEMIGDAIRNGAMRFGCGLYLWSKSEDSERIRNGHYEDSSSGAEEAAPPDMQSTAQPGQQAQQEPAPAAQAAQQQPAPPQQKGGKQPSEIDWWRIFQTAKTGGLGNVKGYFAYASTHGAPKQVLDEIRQWIEQTENNQPIEGEIINGN